jgi:hypothetical protein
LRKEQNSAVVESVSMTYDVVLVDEVERFDAMGEKK